MDRNVVLGVDLVVNHHFPAAFFQSQKGPETSGALVLAVMAPVIVRLLPIFGPKRLIFTGFL